MDDQAIAEAPVLVVAYDDTARAALAASSDRFGVCAVCCASFREAEDLALTRSYRGLVVDLATMIRAKDEEKVIAQSLNRLYPTLRVKAMGPNHPPAALQCAHNAMQEFLTNTCVAFNQRKLRSNRRKDLCIRASVGEERCFTLNISWSGVFIVTMHPERFSLGETLTVTLYPDAESCVDVEVEVARIMPYGERSAPGIGVQFKEIGEEWERHLGALLRSDKDQGRDRLSD